MVNKAYVRVVEFRKGCPGRRGVEVGGGKGFPSRGRSHPLYLQQIRAALVTPHACREPPPPPPTTTITSRSTFGSPVGCESCLSSPFFSGLVQESQGQVATPEARISVGEAPARSQEDPQGKLLMSVSYSWAWPRPLGPNQRVSSPTWKGAEGGHLPLPICTASCVLELRLPTGAPLQEHVRR